MLQSASVSVNLNKDVLKGKLHAVEWFNISECIAVGTAIRLFHFEIRIFSEVPKTMDFIQTKMLHSLSFHLVFYFFKNPNMEM